MTKQQASDLVTFVNEENTRLQSLGADFKPHQAVVDSYGSFYLVSIKFISFYPSSFEVLMNLVRNNDYTFSVHHTTEHSIFVIN